jgi:hypothetical protein
MRPTANGPNSSVLRTDGPTLALKNIILISGLIVCYEAALQGHHNRNPIPYRVVGQFEFEIFIAFSLRNKIP